MTNEISKKTAAGVFYASAIILLILDQITKYIARATLTEGRVITVIPNLLEFKLSFNTGAAFGIMPSWGPLFAIAAILAIYFILRLRHSQPQSKALSIGMGILMGGAIGNIIDRIFTPQKAVTDFIAIFIETSGRRQEWPNFNIADAGIVIGAIMMIFLIKRNNTTCECKED
ncbi:MAG: signal peptidase II [Armatimonadota bacterium]